MAGRNRGAHEAPDNRRVYPPEGPFVQGSFPRLMPLRRSSLEEELEMELYGTRDLLSEYRLLFREQFAEASELRASNEELHRMNLAGAEILAVQEARSRELMERVLKLEADLRAAEPLKNEVTQLRAEVMRLNTMKEDLTAQIQYLNQDISIFQNDSQKISVLRAELDGLRQELFRARTVIDCEKRANVELMEQRQAMEKNMVTVVRELEKLRVELSGSDRRTRETGGPYRINYNGPDGSYHATYREGYGVHPDAAGNGPLYGSSSTSWRGAEKPQTRR